MAVTLQLMVSSVLSSFNSRDVGGLRRVNDLCIDEFAITGNSVFFELCILSYSLAKIVGKPRYWDSPRRLSYMKKISANLAELSISLKYPIPDARATSGIARVTKNVEQLDKGDQRYVRSLENKARLKVASVLYAKGFSLSKAVELTGVEKHDLMEFSGATTMFERASGGRKFTERLKDARKIFA